MDLFVSVSDKPRQQVVYLFTNVDSVYYSHRQPSVRLVTVRYWYVLGRGVL